MRCCGGCEVWIVTQFRCDTSRPTHLSVMWSHACIQLHCLVMWRKWGNAYRRTVRVIGVCVEVFALLYHLLRADLPPTERNDGNPRDGRRRKIESLLLETQFCALYVHQRATGKRKLSSSIRVIHSSRGVFCLFVLNSQLVNDLLCCVAGTPRTGSPRCLGLTPE